MNYLMFSKTWTASNNFTAFVKLVGLPSMKSLMMIKTWVLFKGFATLCTFIRLLFSVNSLMSGINPKEYQIVRTHTKETTWIQDLASPNHSSTLCRMPHLNNKQNKNTNPVISRQDYHLTQPSSEEKQKLSTNLTLYEAYTNHWTNLRRAETKRKKEFNLEAWEMETSNTIS